MSVTVLASAAMIAAASVSPADIAVQDVATSASAEQTAPAPDPVAPVAPTILLPQPAFNAPTTVPAQPPALDQISQPQDAIVVSGEREVPQDPMQAVNEASYNAVQAVDGAVIAPLAVGYEKAVPAPVRKGLRNFLLNLTEPVVALNFLLQLKPGKAAETLGRFAINSTIGVAGLIDVAKKKPFNLPYRVNGFGYTFGYYGIGTGPYFFLPLVGPTTLRDVVGLGLDRFLMPFAVGGPLKHPAYVYGGFVVRSLDDRVEKDALFARIREESNPYASYRELYLKTRQAEIDALKGKADFQKEGSVELPPATARPVVQAAPTPVPVTVAPAVPQTVFVSEPVVQALPAGYAPRR
ncbi:phospholipid-binding lipoprotein MlaA [Novosphingobium hassiacum]|uniref:Phospholipid-binding lipoprotein MlaA n=1 Tax=Novosphingobium hassiacum TaxID=173676 RepID=A0A7W5ZW41_9SPHN|nr:VacJ family lipoprotein [Novosphingobium hassiacum]MBB3858975.1 phospholipid-binding lipoprotein MlaA [Novosphingobium hassiacum]